MDAKLTISVPVTYDYLTEQYKAYRSPNDKLSRLAKGGELIRLKKGLYLPAEREGQRLAPAELIANLLLGPSYVSLETALSFYGMIPERVYTTRSVTTKRSKSFQTPVGRFEYFTVNHRYFSIGVRSIVRDGVAFLMASPEKAICDMIVKTAGLKIQSLKAMREYIEEDLRIDLAEVMPMDSSIFSEVLDVGVKRREIEFLKEYCENGEQSV